MSPEEALLRLCMGAETAGAGPELLPLVAEAFTPERVHAAGLAPALFHHRAAVRHGLPPHVAAWMDRIREFVLRDAAAMLPRERGWQVLLRDMGRAGISTCLLKGSALRTLGESVPGRTQVDLDLLVRPGELEEAERFLLARGYRLRTRYRDREGYLRDHFHFPMTGPEGHVELHWSLARNAPPGAVDRLWGRSVPLPGEASHRVLSPGDRLLHGCIHIVEHDFAGMARWLVELGEALHHADGAARELFRGEAPRWPRRAVGVPLGFLALHGMTAAAEAASGLPGGPPARLPLSALRAVAFHRGIPGVPPSVLQAAVSRWLRSDAGFPRALARSWTEGLRARLAGGTDPEADAG